MFCRSQRLFALRFIVNQRTSVHIKKRLIENLIEISVKIIHKKTNQNIASIKSPEFGKLCYFTLKIIKTKI
ncbi:hypothetical protein BpHYR1_054384 [Brachionus plicatilis]|uniref:Uncharacterized protein n=1 Tax=Brachionus plicatilis TaxID=10195 RepID=A0A3M7QI18_BRAPC|nr:hypothetical protein BpHYR1_054384 [Brachionus plicatilis]